MLEGHIYPKFSHEIWIDGCIEHVKVFYQFLGIHNTEKIKTLTPEFSKVNEFYKKEMDIRYATPQVEHILG